ncbi:hypothetical protein LOK49_LG10G02225 [Camellia lanceoleosa]|uniref:Uncharacterized protein n=1 Tax=Camellia lanceoleosa TaxID=1840588 RepID=A0ACC0G7I7_9ERIC|nr:hypothetical protein LOK49_LG10G02225 [Camellia lanceoleosa]
MASSRGRKELHGEKKNIDGLFNLSKMLFDIEIDPADGVASVRRASKAGVGERKDWVTDALNATRVAMEEGIVPGNG